MVGEIIVYGHAVGFAAQLQTAAGVDKAAQRVGRIGRQHADMPGGGDGHQAVMHIMLADQRPLHFADFLAVQPHFPGGSIGGELFRLPVPLFANQLLLAPAAHRHRLLQIDVVLRQDNLAFARHNTHQMMKLLLDSF